MAELMSQLVDPEKGWKRISCADSNIIYSGDWEIETDPTYWNNYSRYTYDTNAYLEFYFLGSKFRLITIAFPNKCGDNNIEIDNNIYTFSSFLEYGQVRTLSFEKLNLKYCIHKVKIYSKVIGGIYNMQIEAFDIDEKGKILSTKQKYLFKTSDKYIGGGKFSLDTSLLDIKNDNKLISIVDINNKLNKGEIDYKFNLLWFK